MADSSLTLLIQAVDEASGRINKIEESLSRLNKTAQKATLSDSLKATGQRMQDVGKTMTTHMTLPIVAGLGYATKAAMDFESSLSDVNKVTGMQAGTQQAQAFGDEILKLSRTVPLAATELATIAAAGGGLGVAQDQLIEFTELTAKMSTAFEMSADQAGSSIGKMMNLYGVSVNEAEDLGNSINLVSDKTSANASQMVDVATRIGGMATTFGLSADEAVGLAGAFLQAGGTAETSGTAINGMLQKLSTATINGETFAAGLDRIGLSGAQLEAAIKEDAVGALDMFMGKLNQLPTDERAKALSQLFGSGSDTALITKLAGDMDMYRTTMATATDETQRHNSMQNEFNARSATSANAVSTMGNRFNELAIKVGGAITPAIVAAVAAINPLISKLAEFAAQNPGITTVAVAFLAVVAALGPVIVVIGSIVAAIGVLAPVIAGIAAGIASAFALISTGFTVVSLIFGALAAAITLPMVAVALLVAGLVAGAVWVVTHWAQVKTFFSNLGSAISAAWSSMTSALSSGFSSAMASIGSAFNQLKARAAATFIEMRGKAIIAIAGLTAAFQNGVARVRGAMSAIKNAIISTLTSVASGAMAAGRRIVTSIADGIRAGIGAVSSAASAVAAAVRSKLPNSPVPEGPLKILNGTHNAGWRISSMIAGGMQRGTSLVGDAASQSVSPVAMAASAGTGTSNSSTFAPTVTINVNGGGNPQAVGEEVKRQVAELFAQFQQQQSRQNWLSYS